MGTATTVAAERRGSSDPAGQHGASLAAPAWGWSPWYQRPGSRFLGFSCSSRPGWLTAGRGRKQRHLAEGGRAARIH